MSTLPTWKIFVGDVLDRLKALPDNSVHCVVTSPPYWALRDYGTGTWEGETWTGGDPSHRHQQQQQRVQSESSTVTGGAASYRTIGECVCGAKRDCDHVEVRPHRNAGFNERWGNSSGEQRQEQTEPTQYRAKCAKCGARRIDRQIGLEPTPEEFYAKLVDVFREVRRVLRPDGVCWVNHGDCYYSSRSFAGPG